MQLPSRAFAASAVLLMTLAVPSAVAAAYTSTVTGTTATMIGDVAGDTLTITQAGGLFRHNRFTAGDLGFNSDVDFDTFVAGDQTVSSVIGVINVNAGDGNDTIALGDGINLRGTIDGGIGTDTLSYAAYTTPIHANLGLGTTGLAGTLGPDQLVPPAANPTTGTITVTNYSITTHTFDLTFTVNGLPQAIIATGFHIHQAAVGANGPIVVDLGGLLNPVGPGFTETANGVVLPAVSEAALLGGGAYFDIHTTDFPGGMIRGQIFSGGNVNLATGAATGAASVTNVESVTGGAGGDSLVGNSSVNTISGGAGADWLVGGPGNDTLNGDAGADVLVWSNGDGTDVMEGGADGDTVQVNGSTAAGDVFLATPNGTRLRLDRTNLGLFSLDIGTTEALIVNGIGGDDSFTVASLAGVAALVTLNQNGFDGNDTFTYTAASSGAIVFNTLGGPGTNTLVGSNSASTWSVTAPNEGNIAGLTSFRSIAVLTGGTAADTFNVRSFATGNLMTVNGGGGSDTLIYDAQSRAVGGGLTPPDGQLDSPGLLPLAFTQIESLSIIHRPAVSSDFDGDGKTDITVFRPSSGTWFTLQSSTLAPSTLAWGTSRDVPVPGDYDGDGKIDIAVYRPGNGTWFILRSSDSTLLTLAWGVNGDVPVPADYDGDGKTDIGVWRPSTGTWFVLASTDGAASLAWGSSTDVPLPGDYDGDGNIDVAVYRPSTGTWFIFGSSVGSAQLAWGSSIDVPVPADYDGDGVIDIAVYRRSAGTWFILGSSTGPTTVAWGSNLDTAVPADYDGDGKADIAVFRPSTGTWYIIQSATSTVSTVNWGISGDVVVSRPH